MNKTLKRREMINKRKKLSKSQRLDFSNQVISKLIATDEYKKSNNIFVFVSTNEEVYTHNFIKSSISEGKNIFVPYVNPKEKLMYATKINDFSELEVGFYDILSVKEENLNIIKPEKLDLIIVPGLIFGENFYRIGYGGGYYDKYLSNNINGKSIGICFDFQLVEKVDYKNHDVPVDKIITDKRIIERNSYE